MADQTGSNASTGNASGKASGNASDGTSGDVSGAASGNATPESVTNDTRVSFYILKKPCPNGRMTVACRLAETAYRHGHRVYMHTASPADADTLDKLLWTFTERSFVPHITTTRLNRKTNHGDAVGQPVYPVVIGSEPPDTSHTDVLIPLLDDIPDYFVRFSRVMEAVDTEETEKQNARRRFAHYREHGITPESHDISP